MKKLNCSFVSLGVAALAMPTAMGVGILVDPGFEDPLINNGQGVGKWGPFNGGGPSFTNISTTNARSGSSHLNIGTGGAANNFAGVFQDLTVTPGEELTFSGFHAAFNNSPSGIEIRFEWRDSGTNTEIGRTANFIPSPGSAYEPFSLTNTVPVGANTVRVVYAVQSFSGSVNTNVHVDDVSMTSIPEPSSALLAGAGLLGLLARRRR